MGSNDDVERTTVVLEHDRPAWLIGSAVVVFVAMLVFVTAQLTRSAETPAADNHVGATRSLPAPPPARATDVNRAPTISELEAAGQRSVATAPPTTEEPAPPSSLPTTTQDPAVVAQTKHDLALTLAPDRTSVTIGDRMWVDVNVTNTSSSASYVLEGGDGPVFVALRPREPWAVPGTLPGTGPTGFRTDDGTSLAEYLSWIPNASLYDGGVPPARLDGGSSSGPTPDITLTPGHTITSRFAIDVDDGGLVPPGGRATLTASTTVLPTYTQVKVEIPMTVVDRPERRPSWNPAVSAVDSSDVTRHWIAEHQGPRDPNPGGVDVSVRYRTNRWEVWFFERADLVLNSDGTETRPRLALRVLAAADVSGRVLEVRELRMGVPPSDDPDAVGALPASEHVLFRAE